MATAGPMPNWTEGIRRFRPLFRPHLSIASPANANTPLRTGKIHPDSGFSIENFLKKPEFFVVRIRLSRHFEQFPDHSSSTPAVSGRVASAGRKSLPAAGEKKNGHQGGLDDMDSESADSSPPPPPAVRATPRGRGGWRGGRARGRGRGRGGRGVGRPPSAHSPALLAERRRIRLAEVKSNPSIHLFNFLGF